MTDRIRVAMALEEKGMGITSGILWRWVAIIFIAGGLMGCGEKFSEQGRSFATKAIQALIDKRMCRDAKDCHSKMDIAGADGNQVHVVIYDVKDRQALAAYIEFSIAHGIEITGGVPISITVYSKPRNEYVNKIFSRKNPIVEVEVKA